MSDTALALLVLATFGIAILWGLIVFGRWLETFQVETRRVECPVHRREATVEFLVDGAGAEANRDVLACSLLPPGEPATCGKTCRSTSVAPFGVAPI
ncbi:MAG TPA: hypothetical protein VKA21_08805 [Candidatus Binatia bacterium]|nr:hypothetical protein [Candidatus Binatia bacterium]